MGLDRIRETADGPPIPDKEMNDDIEPVGSNPPSNNEKKSFLLEYEGPTQLYRILHHRYRGARISAAHISAAQNSAIFLLKCDTR